MKEKRREINSKYYGVLLLLLLPTLTNTQNATQVCPYLTCDPKISKLDAGSCFALEGNGPIKYIYGQPCYDPLTAKPSDIPNVCPFNLKDGSYGWLNETL
jgi:hypothetical protein